MSSLVSCYNGVVSAVCCFTAVVQLCAETCLESKYYGLQYGNEVSELNLVMPLRIALPSKIPAAPTGERMNARRHIHCFPCFPCFPSCFFLNSRTGQEIGKIISVLPCVFSPIPKTRKMHYSVRTASEFRTFRFKKSWKTRKHTRKTRKHEEGGNVD